MEFDVIYYVHVLISGLRIATYLLTKIPNLDVFRTALHAVRLWLTQVHLEKAIKTEREREFVGNTD